MVTEYPGTYVETDATFMHNTTHSWNHGLGEMISAFRAGMQITDSLSTTASPGRRCPER